MLTVTLYNLSVKIETNEQKLRDHIDKFIERHYTSKAQAFGGTEAVDKKFASVVGTLGTYYLHTNQFIHLLQHLAQASYDISHAVREDKRDYPITMEHYTVRDKYVLRDYQIPIDDFLTKDPKGSRLVSLQTGKGKAQPLDARIKVPGSWIYMRNVRVGDTITAKDGSPTKVTGVFPQGSQSVFTLTMSDGRVCKASDEHLWKVYVNECGCETTELITTKRILGLLATKGVTVHIDLPNPENTKQSSARYSSVYTSGKPIPPEALEGTIKHRYNLLASVLSTFISLSASSSRRYITENYLLAKQVQYLTRSLGGTASVERTVSVTKKNPYYVISLGEIVTTSLEEFLATKDTSRRIQVSKVQYVSFAPVQCISIDHPDKLYVTDEFTVTHNTMIAMTSLAKVGMRIGVVLLATYCPKWLKDIADIHVATTMEVMVIQGSKAIRWIVAMAKDGELTSKYYIFSSRTLQEFITNYEENPDETVQSYGISPIELFPLLGIGTLLVDETHQQFHAIFKILLHTNVRFQVGLSATLISDDEVVSRVHKVVYTAKNTYDGGELDRYCDVYALTYSMPINFARQVRLSNYGSNSYSHTAFEQSIMKVPAMFSFYVSLVDTTLLDFYIEKYELKDKCMIFVATIKLADKLTARYSELYPTKIVKRYCESDPFSNLYEADIIVTTIMSAGTAVDVPDLRVVIQTVSISSPVANIQSLGRLRKLSDNRDTRFCYIYADNIPKQKQYHYRRQDLFRERVATHRLFRARSSY